MKPQMFHASGWLAASACAVALLLAAVPTWAQAQVYRCGNEYTNRPASRKGCVPMTGGNVTVVQGGAPPVATPKPAPRAAPSSASAPAASGAVSNIVQQRRDADRKAILTRELERAQRHQADLEAEYKDGQPDKIGGEAHNYQKYLDRVAALKAAIERNQADIAGIQRELERVP